MLALVVLFLVLLAAKIVTALVRMLLLIARPAGTGEHPLHAEPGTVVTLVHGTFARHAPWTMPGSELAMALGEGLPGPVNVFRFVWSGRNSFAARARGRRELRRHLKACIAKYPDAKHIVVGHSHGGSITLDAITRDYSRKLAAVVCLATPVLSVRLRRLPTTMLWVLGCVPLFLSIGILAGLNDAYGWLSDSVAPVLFIPALIVTVIINAWALQMAGRLTVTRDRGALDPGRVLFVRSIADEASGLITLSHFLSWINTAIFQFPIILVSRFYDWSQRMKALLLSKKPLFFVGTTVLLVGGLTMLLTSPVDVEAVALGAREVLGGLALLIAALLLLTVAGGGVFALYALIMLAVVALPMVLVNGILGLAAGPELVLVGSLVETSAEACPLGNWRVLMFDGDMEDCIDADAPLRHSSLYDSPTALNAIVAWINEAIERGHASAD